MVIFAPQNLIMDPPFTKLDILSCRNLLIYLTAGDAEETDSAVSLQPESRRHFVSRQRGDGRRFHRPVCTRSAANRGSSGGRNPSCDRSRSIFPRPLAPALPTGPEAQPAAKPPASLQSLADQLVLERYCPAGRARQ